MVGWSPWQKGSRVTKEKSTCPCTSTAETFERAGREMLGAAIKVPGTPFSIIRQVIS